MVKNSLYSYILLPLFPLFFLGGKFALLSLLTMTSASLIGDSFTVRFQDFIKES